MIQKQYAVILTGASIKTLEHLCREKIKMSPSDTMMLRSIITALHNGLKK